MDGHGRLMLKQIAGGLSKQSMLNQLLVCWCATWLNDEHHASCHSLALTRFRRVFFCRMELSGAPLMGSAFIYGVVCVVRCSII